MSQMGDGSCRPLFPILAGFLAGALLGGICLGWPALAQKAQFPAKTQAAGSLVVEEIRLVDAAGKPRARITPAPGEEGVTLALYHRDGRHMTLYRLNPTGLPTISLVPVP